MKLLITGTLIFVAFITLNIIFNPSEQYIVPGWAHGVVLCGPQSIIINVGHQHDPEVQELLALADKCKEE